MKYSWYKKCMPRIEDITPHLGEIADEIKKIGGVKEVYVWGSYAKHITHEQFRIADLDIIVKTSFDSGDLLSVDESVLENRYSSDYLEEQGYDPIAIKFSQDITKINKFNIDPWCISMDNMLLHWGPVSVLQAESEEINADAENFATNKTGLSRKRINRSSERTRNNWYNSYTDFKEQYFSKMPLGWYKSEETNMKSVIDKSIKL